MASVDRAGTFRLGDLPVNRLGYGAMQLSGRGIFGPPRDREMALAVLREAVTSSLAHLRENLAAAELDLPDEALKRLDDVTSLPVG